MPELPEVETTRRGVAPYLDGATLQGAIVRDGRLRWPVPPQLDAILSGLTVRAVTRRAKYLIIHFDSGSLLIHLGMSGDRKSVV